MIRRSPEQRLQWDFQPQNRAFKQQNKTQSPRYSSETRSSSDSQRSLDRMMQPQEQMMNMQMSDSSNSQHLQFGPQDCGAAPSLIDHFVS